MVKFSINWFSNLSTHECVLNVDKNLIINTQGEVKERKTINIDKVKYDSFELTVNCCPLKNMGKSNILQKIIGAIIGIFVFFGKDYYVFDFYNYSLRYLIYIDSVEPEVTLSINENKRHGLPSNINIICKNCHIIKKEEELAKNYEFLFEMYFDFFKLNYLRSFIFVVFCIFLIVVGVYNNNIATIVFPTIITLGVLLGHAFLNKKLFYMLKAAI